MFLNSINDLNEIKKHILGINIIPCADLKTLSANNIFSCSLSFPDDFFSGSAHDIYIYVSATCRLSVNNKRTLQQNTLNAYMYNVTVTLFKVPEKTYESFKCHNITIAPSQSIDAPLFIVLHLDTGYRAQNPPA